MGSDRKKTFSAEVFSWCLPDIYLKKVDGFLLAVQPSFWVPKFGSMKIRKHFKPFC